MSFDRIHVSCVLALVVTLGVAACGDSSSAAEQAQSSSQTNPDQIVAEINGRKITLKEVDAKWEEFDAAERARVTQLLYQNRRNMLGQVVGDILIEEAATAAGLSADAYLQKETAARAKPITEAELLQFFEENKDRAQGRSLDELRGPMKEFMASQRALQVRAQVVDELEKKSGGTKVMLDPPRYTVAVASADPVRGDLSAPVTIVEFSDYQCPFCARVNPTLAKGFRPILRVNPTLAKVRETYGNKVKIVFKDFPLPNHLLAPKAAEAAHCAAEQGKYWEMHDAMFANQGALEVPGLKQAAAALGLNAATFDRCLDSGRHGATVAAGMGQGQRLGVNSTPTLYINGRPIIGALPLATANAAPAHA